MARFIALTRRRHNEQGYRESQSLLYNTQSEDSGGGEPIIKGTRFPVRSVVFYIVKEGILPEELVKEFPHLSLSAIYNALSYYYDHTDQIERLTEKNREDQRKKKNRCFAVYQVFFPNSSSHYWYKSRR